MDRGLLYDEHAGPTTALSCSTANLVEDVAEGDDYLILSAGAYGNLSAASFFTLDEYEGPTYSTGLWPIDPTPASAADYCSCLSIYPYRILNSGAGNLDLLTNALVSSGTVTGREAILAAWKPHPLDVWSATFGTQWDLSGDASTSSSSLTALVSKTWDVPTAGDYLIIACASVNKSELTAVFNVALNVDGTHYADATMLANSTTRVMPYMAMTKVSLAAGSHTMSIDMSATTTGSAQLVDGSLVALRCDGYPQVQYAESTGATSVTSVTPTYTTKATLAARFRAQPTLILCSSLASQSFVTRIVLQRAQLNGTDIQGSANTTAIANHEFPHFAADALTPTEGLDYTVTIQAAKATSGAGSGVVSINSATIAAITMKDDATVYIRGGQILAGQIL